RAGHSASVRATSERSSADPCDQPSAGTPTRGWIPSDVCGTLPGRAMDSIKRTRKRCGFSLTDVSARTGLHREVIARAERAGSDARARTLAAIARALGVPVCELFEVTGHERRRR